MGVISQFVSSVLSWRTNRKLVVLESDDWGSIRMSSNSSYENFLKKGHAVDANPYHRWDGLESAEDVRLLMEVLGAHENSQGKKPCMTLNFLSANPDFQKIEQHNFRRYFRKSIEQTYTDYDGNNHIISLVRKGEREGLFDVQFHGTEHLQINRWMKALQDGDKFVREAFNQEVFSPAVANIYSYSMEFMDALDYDNEEEIIDQKENLGAGLKLFKHIWGKTPTSFIAPCYRWSKPIEEFLSHHRVRYIQGQKAQLHPLNKPGYKQRRIFRYTGQTNGFGQTYLVRNVIFEPTLHGSDFALERAKKEVALAFSFGLPAIVSSHRINYTSRLSAANRDSGLQALRQLLSWIMETYPETEFLGSSQLGEMIENSRE